MGDRSNRRAHPDGDRHVSDRGQPGRLSARPHPQYEGPEARDDPDSQPVQVRLRANLNRVQVWQHCSLAGVLSGQLRCFSPLLLFVMYLSVSSSQIQIDPKPPQVLIKTDCLDPTVVQILTPE